MTIKDFPPGFQDLLSFGFVEALLGRRSRRFFMGAEITDGVFAYKSQQEPLPLTELEKMLVITACGANTGWHHLIYRGQIYAPPPVELRRGCGRPDLSLLGRLSYQPELFYGRFRSLFLGHPGRIPL